MTWSGICTLRCSSITDRAVLPGDPRRADPVEANGEGRVARIAVGHKQELLFRETEGELPPYDGHHIQFYAQDFSGPHDELAKRGLITKESNTYQYPFEDIVDVETEETLCSRSSTKSAA